MMSQEYFDPFVEILSKEELLKKSIEEQIKPLLEGTILKKVKKEKKLDTFLGFKRVKNSWNQNWRLDDE